MKDIVARFVYIVKNEEREIETHISTIETTSSGLATAACSFNFSASFALRERGTSTVTILSNK